MSPWQITGQGTNWGYWFPLIPLAHGTFHPEYKEGMGCDP